MTGLEKMRAQILEEAQTSAEAKIQDARGQAEQLLAQAKEEAGRMAGGILAKARSDADILRDKTASAADLDRRTKILSAKQEMIAQVLAQAGQNVRQMDAPAYFELIAGMVEQYVLPQDGQIRFSPTDMERMPAGFAERIKETARAKGGSLALEAGGPEVPDGFVLVYGGVEENCTLGAVFETKRDEMSDRVQKLLFPQA